MFNRSLGQVKPQDVDSELFDITYVRHATAAAGSHHSRVLTEQQSVDSRRHSYELTLLHLSHMLATGTLW
jgi:hypothetical protein